MLEAGEIKELIGRHSTDKPAQYSVEAQLYYEIKVHSDGEAPDKLLDIARPNEPEVIKQYRKQVYQPVTMAYYQKMVTTIAKISQAEDYSIAYNETDESQLLRVYAEERYPQWDSIGNWFWGMALGEMLKDPNAKVVVLPYDLFDKERDNEPYSPKATIINSDRVLEYETGEYILYLAEFYEKEREYVYIDSSKAIEYKSYDAGKTWEITEIPFLFPFALFPVFDLGGPVKYADDDKFVYDSFLSAAMPDLNSAARIHSDNEANIIMHVNPEKWVVRNDKCKTCNGSGTKSITKDNGAKTTIPCSKCSGSGFNATSPFGVHEINMDSIGVGQSPIVPNAGYITKPIDSVKHLEERYEKHLRAALAAVNMEFLYEIPGNQSGVAKAYDRQEINSFLGRVAHHFILNVINPTYYYLAAWLLPPVVSGNDDYILEAVPKVMVPRMFDVLTSDVILDELGRATTNSASAQIQAELQTSYAKKKYHNEPKVWQSVELTGKLDPLLGKTPDEKMTAYANRVVSRVDYVVSENIKQFVDVLLDQSEDFYTLPLLEQRAKLNELAAQKIAEIDVSLRPI